MDRDETSWTTDWHSFVASVGAAFDAGLDDSAVTERFAGQTVTWVGRVSEKRLNGENPGIQLDMPVAHVELSDGRRSTVDYLFLHLAEQDVESWRNVETGATVRFNASITHGNGPFPGIQWSDLDEKRGVILIATENATFLESVNA